VTSRTGRSPHAILTGVAEVDVSDETWIRVLPELVAPVIHDDARWGTWWPRLAVAVQERRGVEGVRWTVVAGDLVGTMEVWLEPAFDGVVLHYFLRLDRADGRALSRRAAHRLRRIHARRAKGVFWAVKDELEEGRR
jgi:hypothetical protein